MSRFFNIPLKATVRLHEPVALSTAILQPILHDDVSYESSDLDLEPHLGGYPKISNGHSNGDLRGHGSKVIWREGHNISLLSKRTGQHVPFRITMLEPACQGHVDQNTRVIVSTTPYDPDDGIDSDDHVDGILDGASSNGKTHISLANFDPDAFLSSSLALALGPSDGDRARNGVATDGDMARSVSSTSGSITPRPPGSTQLHPPSSPPALPDNFYEGDMVDGSATRFSAIAAMGPNGSRADEDVCWVSVGGLGRAGIFEGDWVSHGSHTRLQTGR